MKICLLRHGRTEYNDQHRYQGRRDIPLSPAGRDALRPADFRPDALYVSPMLRARESAAILFPGVPQIPVADLREVSFGVFEGRTYEEMEEDPGFRAWVDSGGQLCCPGGESRRDFSARVCPAFAALVDASLAEGAETVAVVAHGGTQMAVLERFGFPHRGYFDWNAPCGGGFVLDTARWDGERLLEVVGEARYAEE